MGRRNAALISTLPLFGSRAKENAMLRRKDVKIGEDRVFVSFTILKSEARRKVKCSCENVCRFGWKNCPMCGRSLEGLEPLPMRFSAVPIQRQRPLTHPLAGFFVGWAKEAPLDGWMFPKTDSPGGRLGSPLWFKPLSRQSVYMVLRRNIEEYWPHLFRYNLATGFSELGFSEGDLMKWFGWTRYETAEHYTRLGGGARIKKMGESEA